MGDLDPRFLDPDEGVPDQIAGFSDSEIFRRLLPTDPPLSSTDSSPVVVSHDNVRAFLEEALHSGALHPDGTLPDPDGTFAEFDAFRADAQCFMGHVESRQAALTRNFRITLADALDGVDDIIDDTGPDGLPRSDDHRPSAEA